jgi:hypothetical protein
MALAPFTPRLPAGLQQTLNAATTIGTPQFQPFQYNEAPQPQWFAQASQQMSPTQAAGGIFGNSAVTPPVSDWQLGYGTGQIVEQASSALRLAGMSVFGGGNLRPLTETQPWFNQPENVAQRGTWATEAANEYARQQAASAHDASFFAEHGGFGGSGTLRDTAIATGAQNYRGVSDPLEFVNDRVGEGMDAVWRAFEKAQQAREAGSPGIWAPGIGNAKSGDYSGAAGLARTILPREPWELAAEATPLGFLADARRASSASGVLPDVADVARKGVLDVPANAPEAARLASTAGRTVIPSTATAARASTAPFGVRAAGGSPIDDLAKQLIDAEDPADVIAMVRSLDLADQMELSLAVGKTDKQAMLEIGQMITRAAAGDIAEATKLQNRLYAESTTLSKRVAQMTGETVQEARQRAVTKTAQSIGKLRDEQRALGKLPPIGGGAEVPEELSLGQKVWNEAMGVVGAPIAAKSTLSPPFLRQGWTRLVTRPVQAWKELVQSFANLPAEKTSALMDTIRHDEWVRSTKTQAAVDAIKQERYLKGLGTGDIPNQGFSWLDVGGALLDPIDVDDLKDLSLEQIHKLARESGVAFSAIEDKEVIVRRLVTELRPEQLQGLNDSWVANKVRNFTPVKLSDRQMALQLNLNRTNWYREVATKMFDAGVREQEEYIRLRKFIEHATQRGSWSQGNVPFFFSTRALSGRVQFVADLMAEGIIEGVLRGQALKPGVPQEAIKVLMGTTAAASAMVGIPAALGIGAIEMNDGLPTLRIGRQHFDPYAGWNPIAKFMHRFVQDMEKTGTKLGEGTLDWEDMPQSVFQVVTGRTLDFLRNGLSPTVSTGLAAYEGRDWMGTPFNVADRAGSGQLLIDMYAPFILQDLYEAYREEGLKGVALQAGPSILSMSSNTYRNSDSEAEKMFGKPYDLLDYAQRQAVREAIGRPESEYQEARREGGGEARAKQQELGEEAFLAGAFPTNGPDKDLPSLWSNLGKEAFGARSQLGQQFKEMFEGFTPSNADRIIDGYYEQQITNAIGRPDFDATSEAQKAYLNGLSKTPGKDGAPSDYDFMQSYLDYQRQQATPLRREYLEHQDFLDEVGYYDLDDAGKAQLQAEMPQIEAISAWFYSGTDAKTPASLKPDAVPVFEAQNAKWGTNHPYKIEGTDLVINRDEGTMAAYQQGGDIIQSYLAADTKKKAEMRKDNETMAWLALFGYNVKLTNGAQLALFNRLNSQYGLGMTAEKAKDFK